MKKFGYSIVALCFIGLFSCQEDAEKGRTSFQQDLVALSTKHYMLQKSTRAGVIEIDQTVFEEMINEAKELCDKYGVEDKVEKTGYYKNLKIDIEELKNDQYAWVDWIDRNATEEFQKILYELVFNDGPISLNDISENQNLLPNEQIALVIVKNAMNSDPFELTRTAKECMNQYNKEMKVCDKWLYIGSALTVGSAFVSFGTLSAAFATATTIDYKRCSDGAMSNYMECMAKLQVN